MFIPYYVLLIIYGVGIVTYLIWMGFNVWHLAQFGFFDFVGKLNLFLFVALSITIFAFTALLVWQVDWLATFNLFAIPASLFPSIGSSVPEF